MNVQIVFRCFNPEAVSNYTEPHYDRSLIRIFVRCTIDVQHDAEFTNSNNREMTADLILILADGNTYFSKAIKLPFKIWMLQVIIQKCINYFLSLKDSFLLHTLDTLSTYEIVTLF